MKKFFHKVHLWLSIPLGIIITTICLSGTILVFQDEINEWAYPERYFTENTEDDPMPVGRLVKIVNSKLENNSVTSVQIPSDHERNYVMGLKEGNRAFVFINPYTAEITGKSERGEGFFSTVLRLHRWLLGDRDSVGKTIVGYTTLFLVIILISGVVIWWPKNKEQLKKRLKITTRNGQKRFWKDMHVAGGMYITIGLLVLSLTGLYYSFDWYRKGLHGVLGMEMTDYHNQRRHGGGGERQGGNDPRREKSESRPQDEPRGGSAQNPYYADRGGEKDGDNSKRGEGRPHFDSPQDTTEIKTDTIQKQVAGRSNGHGRPERMDSSDDISWKRSGNMFSWQSVVDDLKEKNPDFKTITIQNGSASVVQDFTFGNVRASDKYTFDNETGEITKIELYKEQDGSTKLRGWIYSLHVGAWGGLFSKILTCIVSLLGASLALTGYYIYFVKRNRKNKKV